MNSEWDDIKRAVATEPLEDALQHVIYELKNNVIKAQAYLKFLDVDNPEMEASEMKDVVVTSLAQTLIVVDQLLIEIYIPRLRNNEE